MQRDVLMLLREADARIKQQLAGILARPIQGPTEIVRAEQLRLVQRNLRREMAKLWTELGDKIQARRAEAASRTIQVGQDLNDYLLSRVGGLSDGSRIAANIADAEEAAAASGLDRMIARVQGTSYVPLSQTVYNSAVALNGTVDRLINTGLARGLSASEMAAEVRQFINPNTPGGVRYASMRLARTEINNAAHAVAVHQVQESPWIEDMKWRLSGSHPKADVCDRLAEGGPKGDGVYPKTGVPAKPHPQCFCTAIPVTPSDEDFLDALVSGKYDDHLAKYVAPEDAPKVFAQPPAKPSVRATPKSTPKKTPGKAAPPKSTTPKLDALPKLKRSESRATDIRADLKATNPGYRSDPGYGVNCVHVVNTWEMRARGFDVEATKLPRALIAQNGRNAQEALDRWVLPDGSPHGRQISARFPAEIKTLAERLPEGGRAWVRVSWDAKYGGGGHIFNVEKIDGKVRWIDAQTGRSIDIAEYIFKARPGEAFGFVRVDDLMPTDALTEFFE